ncbi:SH3 domain-containing protein [Metabacillus indicus]|uniref:Peptide-binding protein n=1 Tax=Metabacillus indicus TaxID=246786 RepID=A0A084GXW0_METID|nr:SH3 domain-containing protein [Metabacillus indicus]KEZ52172.1 hypothetical protein GS18_0213935 [Metabacillus indicus]
MKKLVLSFLAASVLIAAADEANPESAKQSATNIGGSTSAKSFTYKPQTELASVKINGVLYGTTLKNASIKNGYLSTNKVLGTIQPNVPLTVLESKNGHYRVIAPYIRGWIASSNVKVRTAPVPFQEKQAVSKVNGTIIRNGYMPHNKQVGTLTLNQHASIIDLKNGYYRVVAGNTRGWVYYKDLQLMPEGVYYGTTLAKETSVKNGFSETSKVISSLNHSTPLTVLETKNGHHRVIAPYTRGWIKTTEVSIQTKAVPFEEKNGKAKTNGVTVRNGYMPHNTKVGSLQLNSRVKIIDLKNGFYRVIADNTRGWVSHNSIALIETDQPVEEPKPPLEPVLVPKEGIVTASALNVRNSPDGQIIGTLTYGQDVKISDLSGAWYKIQSGNLSGWASSSFIDALPLGNDTYQYINLRKPANITADQINLYISEFEKLTGKKSIIAGKGQSFINVGKKYGVNELFLAALAIHESAYGTSYIATTKNNLFGLGAFDIAPFDAAYYFYDIEQNISYQAAFLRSKYLTPGDYRYNGPYLGNKSGGLNVKYSTDEDWGQKIASHMNKMKQMDVGYYDSAQTMNVSLSPYSPPEYQDNYPNNIIALAKSDLPLYESKNGAKTGTIPKNNTFAVTAKTNDYWMIIRFQGKQYWTKAPFSTYNQHFSIYNLLRIRVTGTELNVRQDPSTSANVVGKLKNFTHIQGIMDSNNQVIMDTTKNWYKITTPTIPVGWVHKSYVDRVFP